ncbi:hypothetical protein JET18_06855 [Chryseobacterium sp. L7]|uniref:Uncharacterized protein n=1 Tax=Chryseobacterium endalhagicum TaxID=2797638 RepID=A0ABS1QD59_9FLAO|nr:hypothetical protein [Chryseobacterium endalhagicum]MBL1220551.1 hypothetical protein [Chryseobacterium endalhagicum]
MKSTICLSFLIDKPEISIAFLALIVSIIGVFISIWTIRSSQKHNKLSVKPIAYILPQNYEDKICINIQNKGTGPLIVKNIEFIDLKTKIKTKSLVELMPNLQNYHWSNFSSAKEFVLSPNETKIMLELSGEIDDNIYILNRELIREKLSNIEIYLEYTGIYEDENINIKYLLDWYRRY